MHHKPEIVLYFARKPVIRREITSFTKAGRRRIQTGKQEIRTGNQFAVINLEKKDRYQ
jgi:hypothetical protein